MRFILGCGLAAILALAAQSGVALAQDRTKVRFVILKTASQTAFYVGTVKGIFEKYGFEIESLPLSTGVQANQALASDQADWGGGGMESTVVSWATGLPFNAYSMYAKGGDSYGIVVRNEANIKSPADLAGKRVAVPQGTAPAQGLSQVMQAAGLARDAVGRVNATYGTMGQMLIQGSVDAMVGLEPFVTLTLQKMEGQGTLLMRLGDYVQGGGLFLITDTWAKAHPDKIDDAVAALWESQKWVRDNPTEAARIEAEYLGVDPAIVEVTFKWLHYDPIVDDFTLASLEKTSRYLAAEGLISAPVDIEARLADLQRVTAEVKAAHPQLLE